MVSADLDRPILRTARDAADLLGPRLRGRPHEQVAVAYLDRSRRLIDLVGEPCGADTLLPVGKIVGEALRLGASGLIAAHNRIGGEPVPTEADKAGARLLAEGAASLDLLLHDYFVFAGEDCRSFRALGLL